MFTLNKTNFKSAFIYVVLSAAVQVTTYVVTLGDVYTVNTRALVNIGVLSFLMGITSLLKNLLTTDEGKFLGLVKVIPENK